MGGDAVDNPISNGERTKGLNGEADTFEVDGSGIEEIQENVVSGVSLGCFAEDMQLRHTLNTLMISTPVDTFLLCCILLNVAILAIQTPTNTLSAGVNTTFGVVDAILSVVFSGAPSPCARANLSLCGCQAACERSVGVRSGALC